MDLLDQWGSSLLNDNMEDTTSASGVDTLDAWGESILSGTAPQVPQEPEVSGIEQQETVAPQGNVEDRQKTPAMGNTADYYLFGEYKTQDREVNLRDVVNEAADRTSTFFAGSGLPTALSGTMYAYYAGTQGLMSVVGWEGAADEAEKRKDFWKAKTEEYKVPEYEQSIIDNPMLALTPNYWNYQLGKMAPALAGAPVGGTAGSLIGAATLASQETAATYEEVLEETGGNKFAASGAAATNFALNTVLEAAGLDAIIKPVGRIGTRLFKGFLAEGGTEFTQSFSDNVQKTFWEKAAEGYSVPDIVEYIKPKLSGWLKDAASAGITGGVLGAGISGATGTAAEVPSSKVQAEQMLADMDLLDQVEVGQDPTLKAKLEELDNLPEVDLAPINQTIAPDTPVVQEQPVEGVSAEQVLQEQPLVLESQAEGGAVESQVGEGQSEQGIQQPVEAGQAATQEQPAAVPPQVQEQPLTTEQQVAEAEQRMYGPSENTGRPIDQPLTQRQIDLLDEPPEFKTIDSIAKDPQANPTLLVREVSKSSLANVIRMKLENITGKPVNSMASAVVQVGPVTFQNLVMDTIEQERVKLLETLGTEAPMDTSQVTQGDTYSSSTGPTSFISPEKTFDEAPKIGPRNEQPISTQVGEITQEFPEAPVDSTQRYGSEITEAERQNVELRQFNGERQVLQDVLAAKPAQVVSLAKQLNVLPRVAEILQPMMDKTYRNSSQLIVAAAAKDRAAVNQAVRQAWREKVDAQVMFERQSTVAPTGAVSELEGQLAEGEPAKPRAPRSQEAIDAGAAKMTEESAAYVAKRDSRGLISKALEAGRKVVGSKSRLKKWVETYVENAAGIMERVSPKLYGVIRRFEGRTMDSIKARQEEVREFKDWYAGLDAKDKQLANVALDNWNNPDSRKALYDMIGTDRKALNALSKVESMLKTIQDEFIATGLLSSKKRMDNYFPRRVKDVNELIDYIQSKQGKDSVIKELRDIVGNESLSKEEARVLYQRMLERGYIPGMVMNPQSAKGRTVWSVDNEMADKFYYSPLEALDSHIREATEAIEQRRVIGSSKLAKIQDRVDTLNKKLVKSKAEEVELKSLTDALSNNTITDEGELSDWIDSVIEDGVSNDDQALVIELLKSRFNQGHMTKGLAMLKDISLASALSQFGSAVTQLSDIAPLFNEYGITETLKAMADSKTLTKDDVDLHKTLKDMAGSKKTSKFLDIVLKGTGFEAVDGFFASSGMQAAINRGKKQSFEEFSKKWENVFNPTEMSELYQAVKQGNKANPLLRQMAMIELAEIRPLFPTDMPIGYMRGKNWRILYALKSWTLKTINNMARDIQRTKREKGTLAAAVKGVKNLAFLALAGAGTDTLRDLIMGNEIEIPDAVLDNVMKLFMMNRYQMRGLTESEGFGGVLAQMFAPPTGFLDKPLQDVYKAIKYADDPEKGSDWKTIQEIPAFGRIIWSRYTKGGEDRRLKRRRERMFGALKEAVTSRDPEDMREFRRLRQDYNKFARDLGVKIVSQDSISRAMKRYRKELRAKRD